MSEQVAVRSLPRGVAALATILTLLMLCGLALAPGAGARPRLYWATSGGDIGRANLDGSGLDRHFIDAATVYPSAIAVSARHIYWSDPIRDTIGRARLNGSGVDRDFLSFPGALAFRPHDLIVSGKYIYWSNWSSYIGRARLDGTQAKLKFIQVRYFTPGYLAASGRHLYWTGLAYEEPNVVGRANLDGSGVRNVLFQSETSPFHLAAGGGRLYWTTPTSAIVRANLDGSGVRPRFIVSSGRQPGGIAVAHGRVYWTALAHSSTNPAEDTLLGWIGSSGVGGEGVRWIAVGAGEGTPTDVAIGPGAKPARRGR